VKRVVITGFGIVSSIGNSEKEIFNALYHGHSGVIFSESMKQLNMNSQVWGNIKLNNANFIIPRKMLRFMNDASVYAYIAMLNAIKDAKISTQQYQKNPRVGLIVGSGCAPAKYYACSNLTGSIRNKRSFNSINPYLAIQKMPSGISACLSTFFNIYGVTYSINSACSTSANCIGNAFQLIKYGIQDLVFAGGGDEISLELSYEFDVMKALSTKFNNRPKTASRVYDINRDGFVISGGSGILVIEELNFALSRSAHIYAEIIGYSSISDGDNMIIPSGKGTVRCMQLAKKENNASIDYINTHGTSTKIGDLIELKAIKEVFINEKQPIISATKSITGHSLGAAGVHEIIYILLMFKYNFIAPSINIETLEPYAKNMNIIQKRMDIKIDTAMSNSLGFGGNNVSLIVKKYSHTL